MKSKNFNYSLLAVGVAAVMGLNIANAASPALEANVTVDAFSVKNVAEATYSVAGNDTQQTARSNEVIIKVTEKGQFTLIATLDDSSAGAGNEAGDDINKDIAINPKADTTVSFNHKLTNNGNVADTYTIVANGAVTGDQFDYTLGSDSIRYQIKKIDGDTLIGSEMKIASGGLITLKAGEYADIIIDAKATTKRVIGDNGILTVTATSEYLNKKGASAAASNTDNAITKTPVYAITKSSTTNLNSKFFDIKNPDSFIKYTITVKNEGTDNGTNLTISDNLPIGLIVDTTKGVTVTAIGGSGTSSTTQTANFINTNKGITISGQNININETITVEFFVKQDGKTLDTAKEITNQVIVKDNNGMIDSSNDDDTTENTYEKKVTGGDYKGKDSNTSKITTTSQTRELIITKSDDKEVALISKNNIYSYVIKNNGTDIKEATKAGDIFFTVAPTVNNDKVTIGKVYVDSNNNGVFDVGVDVELAKNTGGNYDLYDAVKNDNATENGLSVNEEVRIFVVVDTDGSGSNDKQDSDIGTSETMAVTVLPQTTINGTIKPDNVSSISITTMEGIDLFKYQAIAACSASISSITVWTKDTVSGNSGPTADQCVFYKLEAKNTFTKPANTISNFILSDDLATTLTYQANSFAASPTAKNESSGQIIKANFGTLSTGTVATVTFSAKLSQTGTNPTLSP